MRLWLRGVKRFVVLLHRYKATRKSLEQCNKGEYPFIPAAPAPFRTHTRTLIAFTHHSLSLDHIHFKLYLHHLANRLRVHIGINEANK